MVRIPKVEEIPIVPRAILCRPAELPTAIALLQDVSQGDAKQGGDEQEQGPEAAAENLGDRHDAER